MFHQLRKIFLLTGFSFFIFANSAWSQTLSSCPNVTVGLYNNGEAAIYSDCSMENTSGSPGFYLTMYFSGGYVTVQPNGAIGSNFTPSPTGDEPYGRWDGSDIVVEDMGAGYTGTCSDMTSPNPTLDSTGVPAVDGNVYCYRVSNTDGNSLWIRGTADIAGNTWGSPIVITNQPGVGTPFTPSAPTPVPTLPLAALGLLGGLAGLLGMRQLRKAA